MEINIANSTLRSRLGFLLAGTQHFRRIHPKHCYSDLLTTAHKENPFPLGFCGIRRGWVFSSIAKLNYKDTAGPRCCHMRLFFLVEDQHKAWIRLRVHELVSAFGTKEISSVQGILFCDIYLMDRWTWSPPIHCQCTQKYQLRTIPVCCSHRPYKYFQPANSCYI